MRETYNWAQAEPNIFLLKSEKDEGTCSYLNVFFKRIHIQTIKELNDPFLNTFSPREVRETRNLYVRVFLRVWDDLKFLDISRSLLPNTQVGLNLTTLPLTSASINPEEGVKKARVELQQVERTKYRNQDILYLCCENDYNAIIDLLMTIK